MSRPIFSTILIVLAVVVFFSFVNPTYEEVRALSEESAQFDNALNRSKELQSVRDELLSRYNTFSNENLDRIEKLLPDNLDNVRLILDLDGIASKYGMLIKNVSIADKEEETSGVVLPQSPVGKMELSFAMTGSYSEFKKFMSDLEQSLRIVDLKRLSFKPQEQNEDIINFEVSVRTYWLK
ncbi:hypothetical protein COV42_02600 [Candidatus Campbellbacteria bacterium CG11_big_fil_rev_8_21_14_0_20_44_21]|uniref:Pilus assembly protein PilO n=1 Tax=Candidatus Campbellbacteria bacterium CG22_combo_CG10-13_8_21_14_all_43_18 TaxID=1974530 RepID=A0A2H0DXV5_9BACT|nr:MAG: hypothetical protein COW82_00675 [Candidatus Campbellbacteria bacterium CG22_combo_CG10-13_8_21_14_all_43_18]PIR24110.1 MAG: hypothetical protein COV42_02600 [Candidatus Campbellbacteria bacterium CG11_big_fil_rev_8_21_14_0_20_44_21]